MSKLFRDWLFSMTPEFDKDILSSWNSEPSCITNAVTGSPYFETLTAVRRISEGAAFKPFDDPEVLEFLEVKGPKLHCDWKKI